ncbi:MAG: Calx-beta domain-containing protein, partial [Planctomycetota bacterium]
MCKKLKLFVCLFMLVGLAGPVLAGTVLQYSFDGSLGSDVPDGLVDDTETYTATIIAGSDPASTIKYAAPNPVYNSGGTSAQFNNVSWANNAGDTFLIPNAGGIDFSTFSEFTAELFINPSSAGSGQYRRVFSEYIYAYMYLDPDNTMHAIRKWGGGGWNENITELTIANFPMDTWSHIAMTWDADAVGDKFKLYLNYELVGQTAGTSTTTIDSTAGFAIGGYQREDTSTAQFSMGMIDEFRLSDAALDPGGFLGAVPTICFDSAASGDLETVSPAVITVSLQGPQEGQTYTVDYAAVEGTATAGEDYYMAGGGPACWNYPTQCHGDCDNDANVKGSDFLALKNSWYQCDPDANYNPCADFDHDGCVKGSDFLILKSNWYQTVEANCPPAGGSATLTFNPGETSKNISIDIIDDGLDEEDETIVIALINPTTTGTEVILGDPNEHVYTIRDPRPAVAFVSETSPSTTEDSGPIVISICLSAPSDEPVAVDYCIIDGTATNGEDYYFTCGTLTFNPGETCKDISIPLVEDDLVEDEETIVLEISNPVNAKLGAITQHTAKIRDPWATGAYEVFKVDLACPGNAATAKEGWVAFEGNQWCDGQRHDGRGISNIADTGIDAYIDNVPQGGSVNL